MSIFDLDAAAEALSALGVAKLLALFTDLMSSSFLTGPGFDGESLDVDRCGILRMSLYFDCLPLWRQSLCNTVRIIARNEGLTLGALPQCHLCAR